MSNLDSFETARAIRELVKGIVSEELKSQRPNPRYATVQAIDRETRSCMVVYVGEDTPVRVPYNGNGPANNGQEVRIEGTQSDRVIADVRGTTETEARVISLEGEIAAREFVAGRWLLENQWPMPTGWATVPILRPADVGGYPAAGGLEMSTGGEVIIPAEGWYDIAISAVVTSGSASVNTRLAIGIRAASAGEIQLAKLTHFSTVPGDNGSSPEVPLSCADTLWLPAGGRVMARTNTSVSGRSLRPWEGGAMITGITVRSAILGPRPGDE